MNIYLSYDESGFEDAKKHSDPIEFDEVDLPEMISFYVNWASHDLNMGFCDSYQIYNESGEIIVNSISLIPKEAA